MVFKSKEKSKQLEDIIIHTKVIDARKPSSSNVGDY